MGWLVPILVIFDFFVQLALSFVVQEQKIIIFCCYSVKVEILSFPTHPQRASNSSGARRYILSNPIANPENTKNPQNITCPSTPLYKESQAKGVFSRILGCYKVCIFFHIVLGSFFWIYIVCTGITYKKARPEIRNFDEIKYFYDFLMYFQCPR